MLNIHEIYYNIKAEKILYMKVQKAQYGMFKSKLLLYKKLRDDLKNNVFELSLDDLCVAKQRNE